MGWKLAAALLVSLTTPLAAGAALPPARLQPAALEHGPRDAKRIALTFDACTTRSPDAYDPRITAELVALHVPATIFVGGGWAVHQPAALLELARDPLLELGNHTFTHPHLRRLPDAAIRDELLRTQDEIAAVTGRAPTLFRPPYGEYDERVVRVAAAAGLTTVEYDLPSGDPDPRLSTGDLVGWVLRQARPGSIVVMHINHRRFHTAEALPAIVAGLRARGFELVSVGDLLRAARPAEAVATAPGRAPGPRGHRTDA